MTSKSIITIAVCAFLIFIGIVGLVQMKVGNTDKMRRRFCSASKMAMEEDIRAFESGDTQRQEAAYNRFFEGHQLYHSAESLQYCLEELPEMPVECELNKNWKCLADLARKIELGL